MDEVRLRRSLYRESFEDYVRAFWPVVVKEPLVWNWHMTFLCQEVQTICERIFAWKPKEYDEVVNICPGSSKSTVLSVMTPTWAWTRMPHFCFVGASYAHDLARDLSMKSRMIVKSPLYQELFPDIKLRDDLDTKDEFGNTLGGLRKAVGSGGSILGRHAHLTGIDDPIDPQGVASEATLLATNDWIASELETRKKDFEVSVTFMIMQRLHQDDPTARKVLEPGVRHVKIPATLEFEVRPKELRQFYKPDPERPDAPYLMDPLRRPWRVLDREKFRLKEYGYAGQYGQDPVPAGGGMFKTDMLRAGRAPAKFKKLVRFWDKAATPPKGKKRIAFTVGVKLGEDFDGKIWVLDVIRKRLDSFSRERLIVRTAKRDGKEVIIGVEQEPGSGGKDSALGTVRRLRGYRVRVLRALGSKEIRADEFSVQFNAGQVWIDEKYRKAGQWVSWAADYVDELKHWPHSTYKDQGDASGGAFTLLVAGNVRVGPLPKNKKTIPENDSKTRRIRRTLFKRGERRRFSRRTY